MTHTNVMIYLERKPAPPLNSFVQTLWYARVPGNEHQYERILPTGCAQIILNLSRDFLLNCLENGCQQRTAPALVVGQRSVYELVATSDMADLIGMVFAPGVLPGFTRDRADLFSNRNVPLDQVWGGWEDTLRSRLREMSSPADRLRTLETWLLVNLAPRMEQTRFSLHPAVRFALQEFGGSSRVSSIAQIARNTGWSERHFSQVFREQVGFRPKVWWRIQRFQSAIRQLRAGAKISLAKLAADCSFYDQAHFANEFRSFSGMDVTTYTAIRHPRWANHTRLE